MLWKMNVSNSCDVSNTRSLLVSQGFATVRPEVQGLKKEIF